MMQDAGLCEADSVKSVIDKYKLTVLDSVK